MNNIETVKKAYELFGAGDIDGLLSLNSDDISWTIPTIENVPFSGSRTGKPAVAEFFTQLADAEEFTHFAPTEFIADGDRVVALGSSKGRVKSTGNQFATDWVHVFTVKDGKITSFLEFFDSAAMTRAYQKTAAA